MPLVKVLHILPDLEPGEGQRTVLDLLAHLDRTRFACHVCALRPGGALAGRLQERHVPFHLVPCGFSLSPLGLLRLIGLVREIGPHIVHAHTDEAEVPGCLAGALGGAPVRVSHLYAPPPPRNGAERYVLARLAPRIDRVFCATAEIRAGRRAQGDVAEDRLEAFPPFVEPAAYRDETPSAAMKAELGFPADATTAGMITRLVPEAHHELFLQAARRLAEEDPHLHFGILGDGPVRGRIVARVRELDLAGRVTLTGYRSDMPRVLRALDALVVPGSREGSGKTILEAQAAGVPVVAFASGGAAELLGGGGGILVPEPRAEAFSAAIAHALRPRERARLVEQGFRNLADYTATRQITRLEDIYLELCERNGAFRGLY